MGTNKYYTVSIILNCLLIYRRITIRVPTFHCLPICWLVFCQLACSTLPEAGNDISQDTPSHIPGLKPASHSDRGGKSAWRGSSFKLFPSFWLCQSRVTQVHLQILDCISSHRGSFCKRLHQLPFTFPFSIIYLCNAALNRHFGDFLLGGFFPWVLTPNINTKASGFCVSGFFWFWFHTSRSSLSWFLLQVCKLISMVNPMVF